MNFNRPKVTRRRRRKGATTHLYDFITLFSFCKVRLRSFFALFLRFLPPFPPPGNDVGGRTQIGTGDARGKGKSLVFSLVSGANATVSRSLSANAPGAGDRILPRTPVARSLFVGATNGRPHFSEYARRPRIDRTSPPSNNVQKRETPRRLPRNGFYLTSGFYRTFGLGFSRREPAPGEPLFMRFRGYSAARTMRSGYTLLVRSVDPSGQIMSRTYPFSPNVTGISTVRVS